MEVLYFSQNDHFIKKQFNDLVCLSEEKGIGALKTVVLAYQNNLRQGNAHSKMRGEVSGTGKKPWRQKGTGMSRQGSKRSPIWPGGGVVFGPRNCDYSQKINRKVRSLALHRALLNHISTESLLVCDSLNLSSNKTSAAVKYINLFSENAATFLFIDVVFEDNFVLASRNLPYVCLMEAVSVNALDLLRFEKIVITESAFNLLVSRLNCKIN